MSVQQYVRANFARDGNGFPIPPTAGDTLIADGAGGGVWGPGIVPTPTVPENVLIYVSNSGDDSNDGLTPGTALASLGVAIDRVNTTGWVYTANIRLMPGVYKIDDERIVRGEGPGPRRSPLIIEGDSLEVYSDGNAVSSIDTNGAITELGGVAVPPQANGQRIRFESGPMAGMSFVVQTVDSFTAAIMTTATPNSGDKFTFEGNNATIVINAPVTFSGCSIVMRNLNLDLPIPSFDPSLKLIDTTLMLSGVKVEDTGGGSYVDVVRSSIMTGLYLRGVPGLASGPQGLYGPMGASFMPQNPYGLVMYFKAGSALRAESTAFTDTQLIIMTASLAEASSSAFRSGFVYVLYGSTMIAEASRFVNSFGNGIYAVNAKIIIAYCDISTSTGSGIQALDSTLHLLSVKSYMKNGDFGLALTQSSHALVDIYTDVTGSSGELAVGNNPPTSWSTVQVGGPGVRNDYTDPQTRNCSVSVV